MKKHLPLISLFGALAVFYFLVDIKYGLLKLPFFWDELGVYSRAAMHLAVHGLSLLPDSMPDVLSRGHPLLTPFIFGTTFKLFGVSQLTARLTGLLIYFIGVGFGFKILARYMNAMWAAAFLFCIAIQPAFIAQSVLVLPETLLMTLTLAAIYAYLTQKHFGLWIALSLAVLTKESALVLPIAFALAQFQQKLSWKIYLSTLLLPFLVFLSFLVIQYNQNGYFLYPLHQGLMDFDIYTILAKTLLALWFLFIAQGRWLFLFLFIAVWVWKRFKKGKTEKKHTDLFYIIFWITIGGLAFSSINYYLDRYCIYILFPLLIGLLVILRNQAIWLKTSVLILSIALSVFHLNNNTEFKDTDLAYTTHIRCLEKGFDYLDSIPANSKVGYNWPMVMANWTSNSGYDVPDHQIDHFKGHNADSFDFVVISDPGQSQLKRYLPDYLEKIKAIRYGYATVTIYKVIPPEEFPPIVIPPDEPTSASDQSVPAENQE